MPRAVGAFRKVGFNAIAFSVGSRTHGWQDFWIPATTATDNLRRLDVAAHEWLGLLYYRLSDYSDEWFPGDVAAAEATHAAQWQNHLSSQVEQRH
jgi:hypothetical protein